VKNKTIKQLNQLNKSFYQIVADDFSDSRQYSWQGWQKIPKFLEKNKKKAKKIKVLDIACGNARFAQFLQKEKNNFDYFALDNSQKLLNIAQETLNKEKTSSKLFNFDLIDNYLNNKKIIWPINEKFDLIVTFGLTHHLPSHELRLEFFQSLKNLLANDGLLIISNWQFANDQRFQKNILNWQKIKKNQKINIFQKIRLKTILKKLEKNDYLLDWRKNKEESLLKAAIRYCHYLDEEESTKLFQKSDYSIIENFLADGKSGQLNQYFVLKKD
jgi:tRNA (uracil-5-)-methyltransferase TRM9